jgi:Cu-processing system permease protein
MFQNPIVSIAKKEVMDNIRNKWIILMSILFTVLTLLASYAGSYFTEGWQDLTLTVGSMSSLVQFFITIIGLMLGYSAIIGEIERGSMSSLLSLPTSRKEIILGKFLGLATVLSLTIIIGFGFAGLIIGINVSDVDYFEYLIFIGSTILIGVVFLNIGLFVSSLFNKRSTAMGGAIFSWFFFVIIWRLVLGTLLVITSVFENLENIESFSIPDWYYAINIINPLEAYSQLISLNIGPIRNMQLDITNLSLPSFYTNEIMLGILFIWIILLILFTFLMFKRKDI